MTKSASTEKTRRRSARLGFVFLAAALAPGCGEPPLDPAGDIQLQSRRKLFVAGDTLDLRWRVDHASRVYIEARGADGGVRMLEADGFPPVGELSIRVERSWLDGRPDGVAFRFALLAEEGANKGGLRVIDITQEIEVLTRDQRDERRRAWRMRQAPPGGPTEP